MAMEREKTQKSVAILAIGGIGTQAHRLAAGSVATCPAACFETVAMIKHGKAEKRAARSKRLAVALRENLKRRKAQARGRTDGGGLDRNAPDGDAEIEAAAPDFRRNPGRKSAAGTGGADR
jgi:hypothetical protein